MTQIFISHSSLDRSVAEALAGWLKRRGFSSIFLDFDPAVGIPAGRDWELELYGRIKASRAVIALCSRNSVMSKWCFAEITQARALGKTLIPIRLDECELDPIVLRLQVLDAVSISGDEYDRRLEQALVAAGVRQTSFMSQQSSRSPYPGLEPFDEEDAEYYFGRGEEIGRAVDMLNRGRRVLGSQAVIVTGASGVGKSSFARAGILPRLRLDPREWTIVEPCRPGREPIKSLEVAFEATHVRVALSPSDVATDGAQQPLSTAEGIASRIIDRADRLRRVSHKQDSNVLIVIDQMEELFSLTNAAAADQFLRVLELVLDEAARISLLGTLRSDFFPDLLATSDNLSMRLELFPLTPISRQALPAIIVEPAVSAGFEVEARLINRLIEDFSVDLALPLLAFVLRELFELSRATRVLSADAYESLGGLSGAVSVVAEGCLPQQISDPSLGELRRSLLRLVRLDEDGRFVKRSATWNELSMNVQPLLERLVRSRLLTSFGGGSQRFLEVAHETVFHAWPRFSDWLKDDHEQFVWLRRIANAAKLWMEDDRNRAQLWSGPRLEVAIGLLDAGMLGTGSPDWEFVRHSRDAFEEEQRLLAKRDDCRNARITELKRYLAPVMKEKLKDLDRWQAVAFETRNIAGFASLSDAKNELAVIRNLLSESGRWHPRAAQFVKHLGAEQDYTDVYTFPCCGTTAIALADFPVTEENLPSQFRDDGCEQVLD